jgi:taurine dioxygenase
MLPEESAPILSFLAGHITQHAFTCRLRWEPETLAIWDNRLCVHQAFNDYQGCRRELYRTTVAGEKPL